MRFLAINPTDATVKPIYATDIFAAAAHVGLHRDRLDNGLICRGLAIWVYEFALYMRQQRYFSIGQQLFGGMAVLEQVDSAGETVDVDEPPAVLFFRDNAEVEHAIKYGDVRRPEFRINDKLLWQWPEPTPPFEMIVEKMREHGTL